MAISTLHCGTSGLPVGVMIDISRLTGCSSAASQDLYPFASFSFLMEICCFKMRKCLLKCGNTSFCFSKIAITPYLLLNSGPHQANHNNWINALYKATVAKECGTRQKCGLTTRGLINNKVETSRRGNAKGDTQQFCERYTFLFLSRTTVPDI